MLQVNALRVVYGNGIVALDGVSLQVPAGIFGLLGPNGAGKSTLLRVLATLQHPDAGSLGFTDADGHFDALAAPQRLRAQLGYLPQEFGLYPTLSVEAVLDHFCALKGATDRDERAAWVTALLARTNLSERRRQTVATLSGGMRQRLGLAIALAGRPALLLLDEPTAGLDPGERRRIYDLLQQVAQDVVVILSTHHTTDVQAVCARFAILHRGRVVAEDSTADALRALRESKGAQASLEDLYFQHVPPSESA